MPYNEEEKELEEESISLFKLFEDKQKQRKKISAKRVEEKLKKENAKLSIGQIIYNTATDEKFIVETVNPLKIIFIWE